MIAPILSSLQLQPQVAQLGGAGSLLVDKISRLFRMTYDLAQGTTFAGYGLKGLGWDGIKQLYNSNQKSKVDLAVNSFQKKNLHFQSLTAQNQIAQGMLYFTSGACSMMEGLNTLEFVNLRSSIPTIHGFGNSCFLFANILSLVHQSRMYRQINQLLVEAKGIEKEILQKIRHSTLLGILSNIGYILSAFIIMFGGPMAITLLFGLIGILFGTAKIIYDLFKVNYENFLAACS